MELCYFCLGLIASAMIIFILYKVWQKEARIDELEKRVYLQGSMITELYEQVNKKAK